MKSPVRTYSGNVFLAVILYTTVFLYGCIDIKEKIALNRNGSGQYTLTIDFTDLIQTLIKTSGDTAKALQTVNLQALCDSFTHAYHAVEGLSQISASTINQTVIEISFLFEDIEALQSALNVHKPGDINMLNYISSTIQSEKKSFLRQSAFEPDTRNFDLMAQLSLIKSLFPDNNYQFEYSMPARIKKVILKDDNGESIFEGNTAIITYPLQQLVIPGTRITHEIRW